MKLIKSKKGVVLLATLAVAAAAAIGAYAWFSSTGHGSGSASVGDATAFTFTNGTPAGGPMYPGSTTDVVSQTYTVNNPSTGSQKLNQVVISVAGTAGDGSPSTFSIPGTGTNPACTASDFQLSLDGTTWATAGDPVTDTTIAADLAGGTSSATHTVYTRMIDTLANQDACQGQDVPLYFAAS